MKENGPSSPNEIATGLNKKGSTTRRMLQNLLKAGDVSSESGRYSLPHSVMNSVNSVNGGVGVNDVTGVHDVHGVHADTEVLPPAGEEEVFDL